MPTPHIRKQIYELTPDDLLQHSVWEFALDEEDEEGQDEATMRPYQLNGPLDPNEGMFIVRALLQLADGTQLGGYLTPPVQGDSDLGTLQPAIVMLGGQVSFWCGVIEPDPIQVSESYALLGKSRPSEVFPIRFESAVELSCGPVTGELPGFLVLEDFNTMKTKVVQ